MHIDWVSILHFYTFPLSLRQCLILALACLFEAVNNPACVRVRTVKPIVEQEDGKDDEESHGDGAKIESANLTRRRSVQIHDLPHMYNTLLNNRSSQEFKFKSD